jgi:hypothetical protein
MMRSLINRLCFDWTVWRLRRKLLRASPALREIETRERAARVAHKAVKPIRAERSKLIHDELAREVGRA